MKNKKKENKTKKKKGKKERKNKDKKGTPMERRGNSVGMRVQCLTDKYRGTGDYNVV